MSKYSIVLNIWHLRSMIFKMNNKALQGKVFSPFSFFFTLKNCIIINEVSSLDDGGIVDGGCNGEVLSDGVIEEEEIGGEVDEGDGAMNEDNQSSTTHVTRTVLADSGVVSEWVGW